MVMHERFHEARADLFVRLIEPKPGSRVLDIGGGDGAFAARLRDRVPLEITVADIHTQHRETLQARGFRSVTLDAAARLPFEENEFDIVVANSVIEHVTLPKELCRTNARVPEREWRSRSRSSQAAFADELRRVGAALFVQTPDKRFPVDPHILLPFTHYLSHNAACRLVSITDRLWIKSCWGVVDWELLTPGLMKRFFPDCDIHVERFAMLPKSIIAYRRANSRNQ